MVTLMSNINYNVTEQELEMLKNADGYVCEDGKHYFRGSELILIKLEDDCWEIEII